MSALPSITTADLAVSRSTHIGLVHHTNEDSSTVFATPHGMLLAVCDGMGGMGRGDEASAIAVQVIEEVLAHAVGFAPTRMEEAIQRADVEIRRRLAVPGNTPGATAVLVHVENGLAHVAWAGDSRAYQLRAGSVVERTRDHKLVNELVDAGELTEAEARQSSLAHVITRALGGRGPNEPAIRPEVMQHPWRLQHGDLLLLCSDGLSDLVEDHELQGFVTGVDLDADLIRLTEVALERGGHDNITCVLARWEGPDFDEEAHQTPLLQDRSHTPLDGDPLRLADHDDAEPTWEEPPRARVVSEADQETIPPLPDRLGTPAPSDARERFVDPATRPRDASEQPRAWMAGAVALLALALIALGLLLAQGVFTNQASVRTDEVQAP